MDANRRKELKEQYKNTRPKMGVFLIKNKVTGKAYIGVSQNLKGTMNGNNFKLGIGVFEDKELQQEWNKYGSDNYEQTILSELDYDKDETKTDYKEDLLALRELVSENYSDKKYL